MKKNYIKITIILLFISVAGFFLGVQYSKYNIQKQTESNKEDIFNERQGYQLEIQALKDKIQKQAESGNTEDLFYKKQECKKYIDEIEEQFKKEDLTIAKTKTQTVNSLEKVFYSPKLNSCLYLSTEIMFIDGKRSIETPRLLNVLTGETILTTIKEWGVDDYYELSEQFEDAVKEYE